MMTRIRRIGLLLVLLFAAACDDCKSLRDFECDLEYCLWEESSHPIVETKTAILGDSFVGTILRQGGSENILQTFNYNWQAAIDGGTPSLDTLESGNIFALTRIGYDPFDDAPTFGGLYNNRLQNWRFSGNQWARQELNATTEYWSSSWSSNGMSAVQTGYDPSGKINFYCQTGPLSWQHCGQFTGTPQGDVIWDSVFGAVRHKIALGWDNQTFMLWDRVFSDGTVTSIGQFDEDKELVCWRDLDVQEVPTSGELLFESTLEFGRLNQSLGYGFYNRDVLNRYPVVGIVALDPCYAQGSCPPGQCVVNGLAEKTTGRYFGTQSVPYAPSIQMVPALKSDLAYPLGISHEGEDKELFGALMPRYMNRDWSGSYYADGWRGSFPLKSDVKWSTPAFSAACWGPNCINLFGDEDDGLTAAKNRISRSNPNNEQNFPQLLTGGGVGTELSANNLDADMAAEVTVEIRNQQGELVPFSVSGSMIDFNGSDYNGTYTTTVPAGGKLSLTSPSSGSLMINTVRMTSDKPISGVITFTGAFLASVQNAERLRSFTAPIKTNSSLSLNTGTAIKNLTGEEITVTYQLCDKTGNLLATATETVAMNGQIQQFVTELNWIPESGVTLDFNNFDGTLKGSASGDVAAVALEGRGTQFATLPVTKTN